MTGYNFISSADNERIKLYKRLCTDKKTRRREGLFPLEGARLISDAASENADIRTVFFTKGALEKYGSCIEQLSGIYDSKIFHMISEELSASVSDTGTPQGIFAVCGMPRLDSAAVYDKIRPGDNILILAGIQDPGNMGTMLRTADACGINAVITCSCCDIYSPKTVRSAMGSLMRVTVIDDDISRAAENIRLKGIPLFAAVVGGGAVPLTECDFSRGGAVMIGNEGSGLSEEEAALADTKLTIQMSGRINSLNAAMAAGIIMWELSKRKGGAV